MHALIIARLTLLFMYRSSSSVQHREIRRQSFIHLCVPRIQHRLQHIVGTCHCYCIGFT